jgi:hypothetical protein
MFVVGTDPLQYCSLRKYTDLNIYFYIPGATAIILPSTYSAYWFKGQKNILVTSLKSGKNNAWLNGGRILADNVTSWTPSAITALYLGYYPVTYYTGNITRFASFPLALTQIQAMDITNSWRRTASES